MTEHTIRPTWGWRARLGILVIDKDPVAETDFWSLAPPGVAVHAARFESPRRPGTDSYGADPGRRVAESEDIARGLDVLGQMRLDVICLCFVTSSFLGGTAFDKGFCEGGSATAHGTPVTTAAQAITGAATALRIGHPLVIVPPWFKDAIVEAAGAYFSQAGLPPADIHRFDLGPGWADRQPWQTWDAGAQWEVREDDLYRQVKSKLKPGCDGVIIAGSGFRAVGAIAPLEQDLGIPVITSNQASMWQCLRIARVRTPIGGAGRLLCHPAADPLSAGTR
jgi:maleate isomerase